MKTDTKTEVNHRFLLEKATSFTFHGQGCMLRVSNDTDESPEGEWVIHRYYEDPWYRLGGREPTSYFPPAYLAVKNEGQDRAHYWATWHPERDLDEDDFWYAERYEDVNDAVAVALRIAAGDLKVLEDHRGK